MLQLVLGLAGSGKTSLLLEEINKRAAAGRASILLVPEQFSSSAESLAYQTLGEYKGSFVEVLSFRTLAERILKSCGGITSHILSDAGRVVYVRRALDAVGSQLKVFARQKRSTAFCSLCAQTLAELKTAGATPGLLRQIGAAAEDEKLQEISLVFDAYEAVLEGSAMDPDDFLTLAASRADCGYFNGKACYIDSFDGFTSPEYVMLSAMLGHCESLHVAMCCDRLSASDEVPNLFSPVRRAANRLIKLAQRAGRKVGAPVELTRPLGAATLRLKALNTLLAGRMDVDEWDEQQAADEPPSLWLTAAADEWDELRQVAAQMHRLAMQGVPYSRMAVVCRDVEAYEQVVRRQLGLYGIPCFVDATTSIEYSAPICFLRGALALLRGGLGSGPVLALLKTGLCGYSEEEIAALENYVFTWQPKAADWRQPFCQHPDGLLREMDRTAEAQLKLAEGLRAQVVPKLESFLQKARGGTAEGLSKSLYLLLDGFDAPAHCDNLARVFEQLGDAASAEQTGRAWDLAMDLLDQMAALLGDDAVTADEYDELFLLLVRSTDFGQVPQTLECAVFSGADRMRLAQPHYCFVVGLCEGEFPMQVGYSGLLTHNDRDTLVRGGVEMPGSFENRSMLEEIFFYKALCAPQKGLYLSWPRRRGGQAKEMSAALERAVLAFGPGPQTLDTLALAATPEAAYDLLGSEYRSDSPLAATLYAALEGLGDDRFARRLRLLDAVDNPGDFTAADLPSLHRLMGRELTLSATTAEQYYKCRFSYFLERVLRVRPRRRAEFSPLESGTLVHHILEQVLAEAGPEFASLPDDQLEEMARRHADEFIGRFLPDTTRRTAFALEQIKETTVRLLLFMRDAAAQSRFTIDALELEIGDGPDAVPPLVVETETGERVRVVGKVDRVDTLKQGDATYLCIIDYKTGSRAFKLEELDYGSNIQMMVYMQALCENGGQRYPNAIPAGVLYLSGDPAPAMGTRRKGDVPAFKLSGLMLSDVSILNALDNRENASFLPLRFTKEGQPYKNSPVLDEGAFHAQLDKVRDLLGDMASGVYGGQFSARPLVKGQSRPCDYCPYRAACRHEDGKNEVVMGQTDEEEGQP